MNFMTFNNVFISSLSLKIIFIKKSEEKLKIVHVAQNNFFYHFLSFLYEKMSCGFLYFEKLKFH